MSFQFDNYFGFRTKSVSLPISDGTFISKVLNNDFIPFFCSNGFVGFEDYYQQRYNSLSEKTNEKSISDEEITNKLELLYQQDLQYFQDECTNIRERVSRINYKKYMNFIDFVLLDDESGLTTKEKFFIYREFYSGDFHQITLKVSPQEIKFSCEPANLEDKLKYDNWRKEFFKSGLSPKEFYKKNKLNLKIENSYSFNSFEELFKHVLITMIKNNKRLKKCANCNKYFYPEKRSDTIYCDNISPQDKSLTCKEYGSKKLWYEKTKKNESMTLYRNIYSTKQMRVRRNPEIPSYEKDFTNFKERSKQWKTDVKNGIKTENEFIDWLKSVK